MRFCRHWPWHAALWRVSDIGQWRSFRLASSLMDVFDILTVWSSIQCIKYIHIHILYIHVGSIENRFVGLSGYCPFWHAVLTHERINIYKIAPSCTCKIWFWKLPRENYFTHEAWLFMVVQLRLFFQEIHRRNRNVKENLFFLVIHRRNKNVKDNLIELMNDWLHTFSIVLLRISTT